MIVFLCAQISFTLWNVSSVIVHRQGSIFMVRHFFKMITLSNDTIQQGCEQVPSTHFNRIKIIQQVAILIESVVYFERIEVFMFLITALELSCGSIAFKFCSVLFPILNIQRLRIRVSCGIFRGRQNSWKYGIIIWKSICFRMYFGCSDFSFFLNTGIKRDIFIRNNYKYSDENFSNHYLVVNFMKIQIIPSL